MSYQTSIVWFRQDLRLADNPALTRAIEQSEHILPVFIWDETDPEPYGAASKWWLHYALENLKNALQQKGNTLVFRWGNPKDVLNELIAQSGAEAVFWNRCYTPHQRQRDQDIKENLGTECHSSNGLLLVEPWELKTKSDTFYKVFTPYWKAIQELEFAKDLPVPDAIPSAKNIHSDDIANWNFLPTNPDWAVQMREEWGIKDGKSGVMSEGGAWQYLNEFLSNGIEGYKDNRNIPSRINENLTTSKLSPFLHWGHISPRQIWHRVMKDYDFRNKDAKHFLSEVAWREFSYNLLYHFEDIKHQSMRKEYRNFPWNPNDDQLKRWQKGQTGYPIVDAGMRELWATGWMHNRIRMLVGSLLVKDLLIPWQDGEQWFWDCLVDADPANNTASWQWVAGCGMDAAPYFRVFNPTLQSKKFDSKGEYIRKWVPELAKLDNDAIHAPWENPEKLQKAGIVLGKNYPEPIVDHYEARKLALDAYEDIKKS